MEFIVTHREEKETTVVVEADSKELAEHAVAEAASANWFEKQGVQSLYDDETHASKVGRNEIRHLSRFVVDEEGLLRVPDKE